MPEFGMAQGSQTSRRRWHAEALRPLGSASVQCEQSAILHLFKHSISNVLMAKLMLSSELKLNEAGRTVQSMGACGCTFLSNCSKRSKTGSENGRRGFLQDPVHPQHLLTPALNRGV
jgi:hypothetical protein